MTDAGFYVECPRNLNGFQNMCYCVSRLAFRNCEYDFDFPSGTGVFCKIRGVFCYTDFFVKYFKRELFNEKILLRFRE